MKPNLKIIIADDHPIFIEGVVHLIEKFNLGIVVAMAFNGKELLDKLNSHHPNFLIIDINMPILNGFETIEKIKIRNPELKILVMSMNEDLSVIEKVKKLGVNGFLPKSFDNAQFIDAIKTIVDNLLFFPLKANVKNNNAQLTKREKEISQHIISGKTTKEISEILNLSSYTIDTHRKNICRKTNSKTPMQLRNFLENYKS